MTDVAAKLVDVVTKWHTDNHNLIDQILEAPTDRPLKLDMGGDELVLEGKEINHFKVGLIVAQQMFKDLPFKATPCDGPSHEEV